LAYDKAIFINLGENVPIPPSGSSSVVISISPKSMDIMPSANTPDSPTF
jgi:hypothetical protein